MRLLPSLTLWAVCLLVFTALGFGCAGTTESWDAAAILRPAEQVPDHFNPPDTVTANPQPDAMSCLNPMIDPRDGTKIILVRSAVGMGDYEVPTGRYGVSPSELLRLDCATGTVLGIVRK